METELRPYDGAATGRGQTAAGNAIGRMQASTGAARRTFSGSPEWHRENPAPIIILESLTPPSFRKSPIGCDDEWHLWRSHLTGKAS